MSVDCYYKANTKAKKSAPCDHNALRAGKHTQCCEPGDLCLTNGLCREETVNASSNYAWRYGCTDPTFQDPTCATAYCDGKPETKDQDLKLTWQCPEETTWCCSTGFPMSQEARTNRTNTTCCSMDNLLFKASPPVVFTTAAYFGSAFSIGTLFPSSSAAPNSSVPVSFSVTPTSTRSTVPASPSSSPSNLAIGLGAGLGSVAAIALSIGSFCIWRRRKRRTYSPRGATPVKELSDTGMTEASSAERAEMTGMDCRRKLTSPVSPVELWSPAEPQRMELPTAEKEGRVVGEMPGEEKGRLVAGEMDGRSRD
ncbi:hypothetical protein EK21DRAFT_94551 [Setomelanomma holmii]|uniref:Uncharacterized protein n=1 Tax=Setomelanomma holmii TaxID=210430 RepID=A0A9P4GY64_9PLEO|nr:hypothetical protein EK21DRAFT_94551 [Setomelanomma holmii]